MLKVISQVQNGDGTITIVAENFINSVPAAVLNGASVSGVITVGPHDPEAGSEARLQIVLTITPV
jgi:hypothetical protein